MARFRGYCISQFPSERAAQRRWRTNNAARDGRWVGSTTCKRLKPLHRPSAGVRHVHVNSPVSPRMIPGIYITRWRWRSHALTCTLGTANYCGHRFHDALFKADPVEPRYVALDDPRALLATHGAHVSTGRTLVRGSDVVPIGVD